jgi:hypothetical protein
MAMKVSQMLIDFAADYINLGDTLESKQSYLNSACTAWNIALLPVHMRSEALDDFLTQYRHLNPQDNNVNNLRHNMDLLIQKKLDVFPNVKTPIAHATLQDSGGALSLVAAALPEQDYSASPAPTHRTRTRRTKKHR